MPARVERVGDSIMNEVVIPLSVSEDTIEEFEKNDKNVLRVTIQLPSGEVVSGNGYRVYFDLSKDAMLGLGTELIRAAQRENVEDLFRHLHPSFLSHATTSLGIYLHPSSCELLVAGWEFGTLQELLEADDKAKGGEQLTTDN